MLTSGSGYLASYVTQQTRCGYGDSPWKIRVQVGKTIRLYLHDFEALKRASMTARGEPVVCHMYASIRETGRQSESICGSQQRESVVYSSRTNEIDVHINARDDHESHMKFLIRYEGSCKSYKIRFDVILCFQLVTFMSRQAL